MKLILIVLVALVVGLMVACSSEPAAPAATAAPVAPPPPAYSDAEVIGAVKGHLASAGKDDYCRRVSILISANNDWRVRQDGSNPDKYLVTVSNSPDFSWTFIGSLAKVIPTSKGMVTAWGC